MSVVAISSASVCIDIKNISALASCVVFSTSTVLCSDSMKDDRVDFAIIRLWWSMNCKNGNTTLDAKGSRL